MTSSTVVNKNNLFECNFVKIDVFWLDMYKKITATVYVFSTTCIYNVRVLTKNFFRRVLGLVSFKDDESRSGKCNKNNSTFLFYALFLIKSLKIKLYNLNICKWHQSILAKVEIYYSQVRFEKYLGTHQFRK